MDPKYLEPTGNMIKVEDWSNYNEDTMSQSDIASYKPTYVSKPEKYSKNKTKEILNEKIDELFNTIQKSGGKPSQKKSVKKPQKKKNAEKEYQKTFSQINSANKFI
jgi:hypothetical protein